MVRFVHVALAALLAVLTGCTAEKGLRFQITAEESPISALESEDVILTCIVTSADISNLEALWIGPLPSGQVITETRSINSRFSAGLSPLPSSNHTAESNLLIRNITLGDAGEYTCEVKRTGCDLSTLSAEVKLIITAIRDVPTPSTTPLDKPDSSGVVMYASVSLLASLVITAALIMTTL